MKFSLAQVLEATGGRRCGSGDVVDGVSGPITTDSRTAVSGDWFVALVGPRFDGHDFVGSVLAAGAHGVIVERVVPDIEGVQVVVEDTTRALQDLGRAARARLRCPVIALTGSNGKTTTRAMIACAVAPLGHVHQTQGNLNNHLGVPLSLLAAPEYADVVVLEMGTSSPGEIAVLRDIATPDVRLVTNVGAAHLEELGGLDGVAVEKRSLFDAVGPTDTLVVNVDDPRLQDARGPCTLTFGQAEDATVQVVEATPMPSRGCTPVTLRVRDEVLQLEVPAVGHHMAMNAAAAIATALAVGVSPQHAARAVVAYEPVGRRMRPTRVGGMLFLDDAYNANPSSMKASLDVLAAHDSRRVAVLGDMLELGPEELAFHNEVVAYAWTCGVDAVALHGERMSQTSVAAPDGTPCWVENDPQLLAVRLAAWVREGDVLLFKGSRGARVERVMEALMAALSPATNGAD